MALLVLLSVGGTAHAVSINDGSGIATAYKKGAVMARAVVLNDDGQPILVEYNEDGSEAGVVPIPGDYQDKVDTLRILSAHEYLAQQQRLTLYREQHAQGLARDAELMSRDQFLGQKYRLADNQTEISPPDLPPDINSVLVRGQSARLLPEPKQLVLLSFTVDLTQDYTPPSGTKSLVLTPEGQVIAAAPRHIGPRTGFFGDANEAQSLMGGYNREAEDEIFGPVSGVKVSVSDGFPGSLDVTGEDGKYHFTYRLPPCPGFTFEYTTDAWAELYYANFSPLGAPILPYYLRRQDWDMCIGILAIPPAPNLVAQMDYAGAIGILAGMAVPDVKLDFWVDVMFLTGQIFLQNPDGSGVSIGDKTEYAIFDRSHHETPVAQTYYDFDGDGQPDQAVLGKLIEEPQEDGTLAKVFHPDDEGDVQGVYLSSRGEREGAPDLIRQADTAKALRPTGWLASISQEDLQNTDVLVFREATGELILERRGLREAEVQGRSAIGLGKDEGLYYRLMLRGPRDNYLDISAVRESAFTDWATYNQFTQPYRQRDADHLKSGEWVRLIAINRNTGYVGSQRMQLSDASQGGLLSFPVPPVVMRPPNLRVWAEREYEVEQGLTQGEERQYLVGAEGASLTSDAQVTVYTEWLDHDGRPLPEGLGAAEGRQYGLTGRLAKVVAENTLAPATDGGVQGGDLANFPIGPGLQKQVLHFKDNPSRPEHYYIHVSGTQFNEGPSFDTGTAAAPLDSRPGYLTPFLTPLYDEDSHWQEYNAYRDLKREKQEDPDAIEPTKPLPAYAWHYRPEYQFSRLSLEIDEINRVSKDEEGEETKENLLDMTTPVVASSDDLIEVLYSLIEAEAGRLDPIDGPQELVFAVGAEEVSVELKADRTIHIDNLDHLASLDPEDFLTMRLYVNQDAGNVLWEYAFLAFELLPGFLTNDNPYLYIDADDAAAGPQHIHGLILSGDDSGDSAYQVQWSIDGDGIISPPAQTNPAGVFNAQLTLPTEAGAIITAYAKLNDSGPRPFPTATFKIEPGKPHTIEITQSGQTVIGGLGEIALAIDIKDRFGNPVKDGTALSVSADDLFVTGDPYTTDGKATLWLKGSNTAGSKSVEITAGSATATQSVLVHDVSLTVQVAGEVATGQETPVTVTASSGYGDLTGLDIHLTNHRGRLAAHFVTVQGGSAGTTFSAGEFRGEATIFARVGERVAHQPLNVRDAEPDGYLLDPVIVSGVTAPGSFAVGGAEVQYTNQTTLMVAGTPGESVAVALGDYAEPAITPVLHYPMQSLSPGGTVEDRRGGNPGSATGVTIVQAAYGDLSKAYHFDGSGSVTAPDTDALRFADHVGFTVKLKPGLGSATVVDYPLSGQRLLLQSDGALVYEVKTDTGTYTVASEPVLRGEWLTVGAHYQAGQLTLQVNDAVYSAQGSGTLTKTTASYGIRLGSGLQGDMADFQLFDWSRQPLLTLTGEALDGQAVVQADGYARIGIRVNDAAFAAAATPMRPRGVIDLLFPAAYAEMLQSCNPVFSDDTGLLTKGEMLLTHLLQCRINEQIEKAKIRYQTASGWKAKTVAIAERTFYEGLYQIVYANGTLLLTGGNCLHGVATGNNTTGAGMTCDFLSGLVAVGDIRDFLIHSYHYHIGDDGKFDQAIYTFAGLGLISNLLELTPAGGLGVTADVVFSAARVLPKAYRVAGAPSKFVKSLVPYLDKHVLKAGSLEKQAEAMRKIMPLIQVTALIAFEGDTLKEFVMDAIEDEEDLVAWVEYTFGFVSNPKFEQSAQNGWDRVFALLIREAVAAVPAGLASTAVKEFIEVLRKVRDDPPPIGSNTQRAKAFTAAIKELEQAVANGADLLGNIKHESGTLRGLMVARVIGQEDALRALRNHNGFAGAAALGPDRERTLKFFEKLGNLDIDKLPEAAKTGLVKVFRDFNSGFKKSSGATHQLLEVIERAATVTAVEAERYFVVKGGQFKVVPDLVIKSGDQLIDLDKKAWAPENIKWLLEASLRKNVASPTGEPPGQLYRYLLKLHNENYCCSRWSFDARADKFTYAGADGTASKGADAIRKIIVDEVKSNGVIQKALRQDLGLTKDDLDDLLKKLDGNLAKFVEISEI